MGQPATPAPTSDTTADAGTTSTTVDAGTTGDSGTSDCTPARPGAGPARPSGYADGTVTGDVVSTRFGDVQVQVTISGGQSPT